MGEETEKIDRNNDMIMDIIYTKNPRSGITTDSVLIELNITNSGFSDIRRMYVKNTCFYLSVIDPFNSKDEKIALLSGNTSLRKDESKKLYIHVGREISSETEVGSKWYEKNSKSLMPHMEFEFTLETIAGTLYNEKIYCGSSWDISMKNTENLAERATGIIEEKVDEVHI